MSRTVFYPLHKGGGVCQWASAQVQGEGQQFKTGAGQIPNCLLYTKQNCFHLDLKFLKFKFFVVQVAASKCAMRWFDREAESKMKI